MPSPTKSNFWTRLYSQTDRLTTKIGIFTSGLLLSAIFYLFMLKLWHNWGLYLALALSGSLNIWLKLKHRKAFFLNTLNNGLITFNIITVLCSLIIVILLIGAGQSALN